MTKLKLANSNLAIAYFGSPDFSADFLKKLIIDQSIKRLVEVKLVVTQPDRKVGRKQILTPTPVKEAAKKYDIPVSEVSKWKLGIEAGISLPNLTSAFQNIDLVVVYAFAQKIPAEILKLPKYGFWNIHPSLLPKYRGPSPTAFPLINGDKKTGVTIIKMDEQIDHGPIIAQEEITILPTDKRPDLEKKLTDLAYQMLINLLKNSQINKLTGFQQNHRQATYTKLLKKSDGFVPFATLKKIFNNPLTRQSVNLSISINNLFRGLYDWPGLWTLLRPAKGGTSEGQAPKRLKITGIDFKDGRLIIKKVQLEGKKEVDFETFNRAYKI